MKNLFSIMALSAMLFALASCGEPVKITPSKENISGPLGKYFKVVNREYKIVDGVISIEIERIADGLPQPWDESMEMGWINDRYEPGFIVEFNDVDGDVISKDETSIVKDEDQLTTIMSLSVGESASLKFSANDGDIRQFKVSSTFKCHEPVEEADKDDVSNDGESLKEAISELASEGKSALEEVEDEYAKTLKDVEDYTEAASKAVGVMKDIMDLAL